ncbi:MAG: trypsin-like peptidase domain-containing protein [Dehalococcoidales bacterium]|nr:trypsin-like peptidase domain-containing protein [Dehalococcoidales bacterium]
MKTMMRKIGYLVVTVILVLSVFLSGCNLLLPGQDTSPPVTNPPVTNNTDPIDTGWQTPSMSGNAPLLPDIASVVAQVRPSVVAINIEVITYDIFNRPFTQQGAGSGWIIDESGIIVTNNHVVEGAQSVTVTLSDGRVVSADMVRTDPADDLAVIKINAGRLPAAAIGDVSKLRVGDWLVAIGNPLGLGISAKEGIVSRLGVSTTVSAGQTLYDLIETSAAINPGNSGGPLVNMAGEVIGITSVKIAEVGVEGLGYAISINSAAPIIDDLITVGRVVRPWLGVVLRTVDAGVATQFGLAVNQGALLTEVAQGSPADRAGLRSGDVIVSFDGKDITSIDDLVQAIRTSAIGQTVQITYWRGQNRSNTSATLAESPPA